MKQFDKTELLITTDLELVSGSLAMNIPKHALNYDYKSLFLCIVSELDN